MSTASKGKNGGSGRSSDLHEPLRRPVFIGINAGHDQR